MSQEVEYIDWGLMDYKEAWEKQKRLFNASVEQKRAAANAAIPQRFIVCEHPHVYTLGRNGQVNNMLISEDFLQNINASFYRIERGGDITYHGPGQVVGYPILDLSQLKLSVKDYVHCIEDAIIQTLSDYGIQASRMAGATGVWLDATGTNPRKICAIGIRVSRHITMHGFALNVNTDLSYFSHINPCGFVDKGVTSLSEELRKPVDIEEVKRRVYAHFTSRYKTSKTPPPAHLQQKSLR